MTIIINGRPRSWNHPSISYSKITELAFYKMDSVQRRGATTTYFSADQDQNEGILSSGESIKVKEGTRIHCTFTSKA